MTETTHTVICCCCAKQFEGFYDGQADGCAADVHEDCVIGHYGSAVADMTRLVFTAGKAPEDLPAGGQICDPCLTRMLADGILKETGENRNEITSPEEVEEFFAHITEAYEADD